MTSYNETTANLPSDTSIPEENGDARTSFATVVALHGRSNSTPMQVESATTLDGEARQLVSSNRELEAKEQQDASRKPANLAGARPGIDQRNVHASPVEFQDRIEKAQSEAARLATIETKHAETREASSYTLLELAYEITECRSNHEDAYDKWIKDTGAISRTGRPPGNEFRVTLNAMFSKEARRKLSGHLANCSKVLQGAKESGVAIGGVSQWLRKPEVIGAHGGNRKGFDKGLAAHNCYIRKRRNDADATSEEMHAKHQEEVMVRDAVDRAKETPAAFVKNSAVFDAAAAEGHECGIGLIAFTSEGHAIQLLTKDRSAIEAIFSVLQRTTRKPAVKKRHRH